MERGKLKLGNESFRLPKPDAGYVYPHNRDILAERLTDWGVSAVGKPLYVRYKQYINTFQANLASFNIINVQTGHYLWVQRMQVIQVGFTGVGNFLFYDIPGAAIDITGSLAVATVPYIFEDIFTTRIRYQNTSASAGDVYLSLTYFDISVQ